MASVRIHLALVLILSLWTRRGAHRGPANIHRSSTIARFWWSIRERIRVQSGARRPIATDDGR